MMAYGKIRTIGSSTLTIALGVAMPLGWAYGMDDQPTFPRSAELTRVARDSTSDLLNLFIGASEWKEPASSHIALKAEDLGASRKLKYRPNLCRKVFFTD